MLVNLKKRVKQKGTWTFLSVPRKNGRFQPEKVAALGVYYLEWRPTGKTGKRQQERIGTNPKEALEALYAKQTELNDADPSTASTDDSLGLTIEQACERYEKDIKATRSAATARSYARLVRWFKENVSKMHVSQVTREDIKNLFAKGREEELDQKTINKRVVVALGVIRNAGYDVKLNKGDWPMIAKADPEVYEVEELKKFFAACDERERALFSVFLYTGFRKMEVATLEWNNDINWKQNTLRVQVKPHLKFTPKSYKPRTVPVPQSLMTILKTWKAKSTTALMFPSRQHPKAKRLGGSKIDKRMLEQCKDIAYRARLNCRGCSTPQGKCCDGPFCERWFLHKFRHTFATNMLRSNVDIRTLQGLLGHKTLATTEKYLAMLQPRDLQSKVESSTLAGLLA